MKQKLFLLSATLLLSLSMQSQTSDKKATSPRKLLDPANIDPHIKPGNDFFRYANGSWLRTNPIPPSETRWGSFNELQENNYNALHILLEAAAKVKTDNKNSKEWKVGAFYKSGMNEEAIEKLGLTPLNKLLTRINTISTPSDVVNEIAIEQTEGIASLFNFGVSPDDKNVVKQIPQFAQGGLGLPDRDYYFNKDTRSKNIRDAYKGYISLTLKYMKDENATMAMEQIYSIEEKLAEASMTRIEQRDPYKVYNKFFLEDLSKLTPGINWRMLLISMKMTGQDTVLVAQPKFFTVAANLLNNISVDAWKKYLAFHLVSSMAPYLNRDFDAARFEFYGKTVRGQQEQKPRWKRVLQVIDGSVGELLGQMYVEKNFNAESKKRMLALVNNLQATYADRIKRLDWMSDVTKKKALAKLNSFMKKIGYTDKWKTYSSVTISETDYVANVLSASSYEYDFYISKLGKPVDKTEWGMTPQTVNAYYNPAFNEIVFPAGILQYPFFDFSADDALNYGGIGAVIGHEMTHGFDDQGRQYDETGNLNDWWTKDDAKKFVDKSNVVISQFNEYTVLDTVHVKGELTLGENLADLGGIAIAYEAFKKTAQGKTNNKIDGFTPDQRFFMSWAQVWRANTRPEEMASRIVTDPHSPNEWRCNGPLSNFDPFYEAFSIKLGDKMYRNPKQRAKVW